MDFNETIESIYDTTAAQFERAHGQAKGTFTLSHTAILIRLEELAGLSLSIIDPTSGTFSSGIARAISRQLTSQLVERLKSSPVHVMSNGCPDGWIFGIRVPGTPLLAGGVLLQSRAPLPHWLFDLSQQAGLSDSQFQAWLSRHSGIRPQADRKSVV